MRVVSAFLMLSIFLHGCDRKSSEKHSVSDINRQTTKSKITQIREAVTKIQPGDLIVRCGRDFTSQSLRLLNRRNTDYSHAGIIQIEDNHAYVYHAIGGEFNPDQSLLRESLIDFIHPTTQSGFAVYRLNSQSIDLLNLRLKILKDYQKKLPFDMKFDLATNERMYCSEWVAHCLTASSQKAILFDTSKIGNKQFIGVDDLFLHERMRKIFAISFD
jgi:hypothetical protein